MILLKKHKFKIIFILVIVVLIIASILYLNTRNYKVDKKKDSFSIEYGTNLNINNNELLDTDDESIVNSIIIDKSNLIMVENKDYPKVGSYTLYFTYKVNSNTNKDEFKVVVSDTIAPVFDKKVDEITIELNDSKHDLNKYFSVSDLSEVTLDIDSSKVDFSKAGNYEISVKASDPYQNNTIITCKIIVNKAKETVQSNNGSTSSTTTKKTPYNVKSPTYVNGILIVNKKNPLPSTYAPNENSKAASQVKKMISDMRSSGYDIATNYSGYRSFNTQKTLYNNYVKSDGQTKADTYSARPGYSEHQTGLTFDLLHKNGSLVTKSKEANWIAKNAHKYGFIVRYQAGKESITGYTAEPWHLRYIGDKATTIYNSKKSLEEYLNVEGGGY